MDDYLHDVEICQRFARRSRERMAEIIIERTKMTRTEAFHTIHNYIDVNEMILRKGAIAAHSGEKVLIPINMRDGSVLAVGKGNVEWNNSAPHGAGRIMSRTKAKQSIDLEEYKASMQGIYSTSVNADTLDEAPMAYKSLADIIDVIRDSVEIIDIMKPVYNFKASDSEVPWKREVTQMKEKIQEQLRRIEEAENIKILLAVESGSRAWGFASPDSDYDVRFIYIRRLEDYLRLDAIRDVIELPIDDVLDINGWDLQKTLRLLHKSNPTLFEWFSSPIVYQKTEFADKFRDLMMHYFSSKKTLHHYVSMAEGNYREYLKGDLVRAKNISTFCARYWHANGF